MFVHQISNTLRLGIKLNCKPRQMLFTENILYVMRKSKMQRMPTICDIFQISHVGDIRRKKLSIDCYVFPKTARHSFPFLFNISAVRVIRNRACMLYATQLPIFIG